MGDAFNRPLLMTREGIDLTLSDVRRSLEQQWRIECVSMLPDTYEHFGAVVLPYSRLHLAEVKRRCEHVRRRDRAVGLVVLAVHGEFDDRLSVLASGADEYLVASELTVREISTRIRLIIAKRHLEADAPRASFGVFTVNLIRPLVSFGSQSEELPLHQWQLLKCLVQAMGQIVTTNHLCTFARIQPGAHHCNLQNAMSRLRRRLRPFSDQIETVKGVGYRIIAGEHISR